jgi:hypothetical protein
MMGSRLTSDTGPNAMFWSLTGNGYNAAWKILEQREDVNGDPINDQITIERASVLDNPYIDEAAKEQLRRRYGGTSRAEQALYGGFAAAQGLVYSQFSRETHVHPHSEAHTLAEDGFRAYGYDAGWNDPRVLLELARTPYNQLIVLDEFYESETHVDAAIEWLDSNNKPKGTIYCEHVPDEIEKFRAAGWSAEKANKDLDSGIAEVRSRFDFESADARDRPGTTRRSGAGGKGTPALPSRLERRYQAARGSQPSRSDAERAGPSREQSPDPVPEGPAPGLLISDQCEHLIRELLGYQEEHVGKSTAEDHCVDSLRYVVASLGTASSSNNKPHFTQPPARKLHF